nr:pentatricopeptide repeat-containing protein At1g79540 [Ipomoea batatas]
MKLLSPLRLLTAKPNCGLTHPDFVPNEVLSIIDTVTPMEPALDKVSHFLSSQAVASVIREQRKPELGFRFFIWTTNKKHFRSWDSHNLIIDMLAKDGGYFDLYWKTLEEVKNSAMPICSDAFAVLISAYWKLNKAEMAVECFGRMKDFDCRANPFTYNVILHVMVQKGVILLALAVYNMMLKSNCSPNCSTFSILIDGLCKSGNTLDALKLFDEMSGRGILPNRITYTVILSGLCQAKRIDDACRLFNLMKTRGCSADFVTYNVLLNGFCKLGRVDEALALLKSFKSEGYVVGLEGYSCLIDGLVRAKRISEAHSLFQKLSENNIAPDIVLYTIMIKGLSQEGRVKEALDLLREMTGRGLLPDTQCYNTLIKGFCDMGLLDEAGSLRLEISQHGCFPNTYTTTFLICGMCRNGMVKEATNIFNEMEKLGCSPSVENFNALIHGLCKAGELDEARIMFYKMEIGKKPSLFLRLSQGIDPVHDSASLQSRVKKLCESGLILKAYQLLMQLADSGAELQIRGHSPDSITYGTLIDGLQRVGREDDSLKLFDHISKNGHAPGSSVYRSLMTWSCRRRKIAVAFNLWLRYLRSQGVRSEEAIELVEKHFEEGDTVKAIRTLLEMEIKLADFDSAPYNIWLVGLCQMGRSEEAVKIFYILQEFGLNVSAPSCVMLIHSLSKNKNLDQAVNVFLYTVEKGIRLMPRICNYLLRSLLRSRDSAELVYVVLNGMKSAGQVSSSSNPISIKIVVKHVPPAFSVLH